jgi:hypothetical protein
VAHVSQHVLALRPSTAYTKSVANGTSVGSNGGSLRYAPTTMHEPEFQSNQSVTLGALNL